VRKISRSRVQEARVGIFAAKRPARSEYLNQEPVAQAEHRRGEAGFREAFGSGVFSDAVST
jgi:hypothetical protein